ncbi:MAG: glycosyltransferase family 2 protein [Pseudomonadota bacterium]
MPAATILIPTHEHIACLPHSVASALAQTVQDFELFIVGDGVSAESRAIIAELAATDSRIRFFDFPKGERKGERHRHAALMQATGKIVAYLGDDDIWLPNHLETFLELLDDADFGNTMHIGIGRSGEWLVLPGNLADPAWRARMLNESFNFFDFTFGGHTLEAYRRLPGWAPPIDCPWSDLYMWRQFLAQPWCRAKSAMIPTGICTQTHLRPNRSDHERAEELVTLRSSLKTAKVRKTLRKAIAKSFAKVKLRPDMSALED